MKQRNDGYVKYQQVFKRITLLS